MLGFWVQGLEFPDLGIRCGIDDFRAQGLASIHSRELTWKPNSAPMKTTVPLKGGYMGFHVSLGECRSQI